ncbi:OmpH family outer membrane protein [Pelagibius sp. Alg239-R121]|uniref:OmpH family outer membrane protein n=1 Tax=Pelagibius sp. Alg239-R121 TaxID=2993448 RepID=UPI0024A76362|nr:OmpH family outer membrane protein [Pelagibius sp. Alg239-R121]
MSQRVSACAAQLLRLVILVSCLCAPALAQAQTEAANPAVIGILDTQKVLRESVAMRSLSKEMEARRSTFQEELRQREDELRSADQELARQRSILSAEAFAEKRSELEQQVASLQRQVQARRKELDRVYGQAVKQVQGALVTIAQQIATERKLDLVLPKTAVVLVRNDMEITDEVVKRLNETLTEVTVPSPQN